MDYNFEQLDVAYDNQKYSDIIDPQQWNDNFHEIENVVNANTDELKRYIANADRDTGTISKTLTNLGAFAVAINNEKEALTNKTQIVDELSTDTQYPSAAAVRYAIDKSVSAAETDIRLTLDDHIEDETVHISFEERNKWNDKVDSTDFSNHLNDTKMHIVESERIVWNAKVNQTELNAHTSNVNMHVTAEDKFNWNGKANSIDLLAHTNYNDIHVTAEEKARWNAGGGGGGGTSDYNALTNKPSINGTTLLGDVSIDDIGAENPSNKVHVSNTIENMTPIQGVDKYPSVQGMKSWTSARFEEVSNKLDSIFNSDGSMKTVVEDAYISHKAIVEYTAKYVVGYFLQKNALLKSTSSVGSGNDVNIPTTKTMVNYVNSKLGDIETILDSIIAG